ncbi:MAG: galactokinase family protein [Acidobacteriota bacterium]
MAQPIEDAFLLRFGHPPAVVARAPGRVNLIGEHTDYSLLPVLPIAIGPSIRVAALPSDEGRVEAVSLAEPGDAWQRYVRGALDLLPERPRGAGAKLMVGGDLPSMGGLSSSSALTVGVLAALDLLWALGLDRDELVRRAIAAERSVGIECGGMDQTVIVHGRAGMAVHVSFLPAELRHVPLPAELGIVAAHSGVAARKSGAAGDLYDARVIGCRIAAAMISADLGREAADPPVLGHVACAAGIGAAIGRLPDELTVLESALHLGVAAWPLARLSRGTFPEDVPVAIREPARHVIDEATRVGDAVLALVREDLAAFGSLLDASHASLQRFGASTGELDRLVAAMRAAGAFGARLTGAGFGGFAIAAAPRANVAAVVDAAVRATGGPAFEVRAADGLSR